MVQQMVQLVYRQALLMASRQRQHLTVSGIESVVKTPKKPCHREIRLPVSIIDGRIDQASFTMVIDDDISIPKITVQQTRPFGRCTQMIENPQLGTVQQPLEIAPVSVIRRQPGLDAQAAFDKKFRPARAGREEGLYDYR